MVAKLGQRPHSCCSDMMFDQLTLTGRMDLSIKGVREAKPTECLTQNFSTTLQSSGIYISIYLCSIQASRKKHARDKLLHFDLDNLVGQEAKAAKVGGSLKLLR